MALAKREIWEMGKSKQSNLDIVVLAENTLNVSLNISVLFTKRKGWIKITQINQ